MGLKLAGVIIILVLCSVKAGRTFYISVVEVFLINVLFNGLVKVLCSLNKKVLDFLIVTLLGGKGRLNYVSIDITKKVTRGVKRVLVTTLIISDRCILCCFPMLLVTKLLAKFLVKLLTRRLVIHLHFLARGCRR